MTKKKDIHQSHLYLHVPTLVNYCKFFMFNTKIKKIILLKRSHKLPTENLYDLTLQSEH